MGVVDQTIAILQPVHIHHVVGCDEIGIIGEFRIALRNCIQASRQQGIHWCCRGNARGHCRGYSDINCLVCINRNDFTNIIAVARYRFGIGIRAVIIEMKIVGSQTGNPGKRTVTLCLLLGNIGIHLIHDILNGHFRGPDRFIGKAADNGDISNRLNATAKCVIEVGFTFMAGKASRLLVNLQQYLGCSKSLVFHLVGSNQNITASRNRAEDIAQLLGLDINILASDQLGQLAIIAEFVLIKDFDNIVRGIGTADHGGPDIRALGCQCVGCDSRRDTGVRIGHLFRCEATRLQDGFDIIRHDCVACRKGFPQVYISGFMSRQNIAISIKNGRIDHIFHFGRRVRRSGLVCLGKHIGPKSFQFGFQSCSAGGCDRGFEKSLCLC